MRTTATYCCDRCKREAAVDLDKCFLPEGWVSIYASDVGPKGESLQKEVCGSCKADLWRWAHDGGKTVSL